jgi:hypothetical protein
MEELTSDPGYDRCGFGGLVGIGKKSKGGV